MRGNSGVIISMKGELVNENRLRSAGPGDDKNKIYRMGKRFFDLVISSIIIVAILSWLMPVIAILIKLNSRGPVFFLQERVGKNGRPFTCYKFRTMIPNRDADSVQASENDYRITGFGRLLRNSNLDELPQFFNVFAGNMSLVGPRPHMHADCLMFSRLIPGYSFRYGAKPGITGLAQIKGFSGPALDRERIFGRYQWDAFYIRNANFSLDLRIMRNTIFQQLKSWVSPLIAMNKKTEA